ncbi:hypothetical protein B0H66DRAFT_528887 [Apodospora peruviana]|uniref:CCHC-type domain-containing protein n=1 Tax=Apodospora peruviana TaxID=516989 RepID=A0AAE0IUJ4_9PEZI|nr:hypothetical protein B0H66DRAFT_528887 [Apodospora peruviana]
MDRPQSHWLGSIPEFKITILKPWLALKHESLAPPRRHRFGRLSQREEVVTPLAHKPSQSSQVHPVLQIRRPVMVRKPEVQAGGSGGSGSGKRTAPNNRGNHGGAPTSTTKAYTPSGTGQASGMKLPPAPSPKEMKKLIAEGRCLTCREPGHTSPICPHNPRNKPGAATSRINSIIDREARDAVIIENHQRYLKRVTFDNTTGGKDDFDLEN